MDRGWLKLWRKSLDSGMLQKPDLWVMWSWCLLKATHKSKKQRVGFQEVMLEPGQFVFGRKVASEELKMSEQTIRTCLDKLVKMKNLTIKSTNKFSIVSIVNWASYQGEENETNQQTNQHLTSTSPASNQQLTTNKKLKNRRTEEQENKDPPASEPEAENSNGCKCYLTKRRRKLEGKKLDSFNEFWKAFAYPKGKAAAADAWIDIKLLTNNILREIIEAAKREAAERVSLIESGRTPKWAQGWITERRWEDETIPAQLEADEADRFQKMKESVLAQGKVIVD